MTIDDAAQRMLSGGGATLKFHELGTTHQGRIISATTQQARDFQTNKPKFYDDNKPIMQLVVTLQTEERDADAPDGVRRLFCNRRMLTAVQEACRAAGVTGIDVGGTLAVQYYANGEPENGLTPPKLFRAQYIPPAAGMGAANDLITGQAAPTPAAAPAQQAFATGGVVQRPAPQPSAASWATEGGTPSPAPQPAVNPWG